MIDDRIPGMSFISVDNPSEIHQDDLDRLPAFDAPGLDYEPEFRNRLRDSFQYTRFRHWGTTYFCNGTSFAMLHQFGVSPDFLLTHFRRHYTHLGVIAHFQHAALLYFADELGETAKVLADQSGNDDYSNPAWAEVFARCRGAFEVPHPLVFHGSQQPGSGQGPVPLWYGQLGTQVLFDRVSATNSEVYQALVNHEMKELAKAQMQLASESTEIAKTQKVLAEETKQLTASQTELAGIQTRLSHIAMWGLAISILLSAISAAFTAASLSPPTPFKGYLSLFCGLAIGGFFDAILWIIYRKKPKTPPPSVNA